MLAYLQNSIFLPLVFYFSLFQNFKTNFNLPIEIVRDF